VANFLSRKVASNQPRENYKPRIGRKQSLINFFKAPIRYLKQSNLVESAFEKPYLDSDYLKMHLDVPNPDWPSWKFPVGPRRENLRLPFDGRVSKPPEDFLGCPCCFEVQWNGCTEPQHNGGLWLEGINDPPWDAGTHGWVISGDYKNFRRYPPTPGGAYPAAADAAYFDFDPEKRGGDGFSFVTLCYRISGLCEECREYWATCCDETTALAFDDASTPDTIARSNSITLYTTGSGVPLTWTVSGTGFSLSRATTDGNTNTLSADGTACGSATITVTDCGETQISFTIRCTTGQWVQQTIGGYNTCGSETDGSCGAECSQDCWTGEADPYTYTDGEAQWRIDNTGACQCCDGTTCWQATGSGGSCNCTLPTPPCGLPVACNDGGCNCTDPGYSFTNALGFTYWLWEC
jgi:hypothetical protein